MRRPEDGTSARRVKQESYLLYVYKGLGMVTTVLLPTVLAVSKVDMTNADFTAELGKR